MNPQSRKHLKAVSMPTVVIHVIGSATLVFCRDTEMLESKEVDSDSDGQGKG